MTDTTDKKYDFKASDVVKGLVALAALGLFVNYRDNNRLDAYQQAFNNGDFNISIRTNDGRQISLANPSPDDLYVIDKLVEDGKPHVFFRKYRSKDHQLVTIVVTDSNGNLVCEIKERTKLLQEISEIASSRPRELGKAASIEDLAKICGHSVENINQQLSITYPPTSIQTSPAPIVNTAELTYQTPEGDVRVALQPSWQIG